LSCRAISTQRKGSSYQKLQHYLISLCASSLAWPSCMNGRSGQTTSRWPTCNPHRLYRETSIFARYVARRLFTSNSMDSSSRSSNLVWTRRQRLILFSHLYTSIPWYRSAATCSRRIIAASDLADIFGSYRNQKSWYQPAPEDWPLTVRSVGRNHLIVCYLTD
jgi:hypothetical protein